MTLDQTERNVLSDWIEENFDGIMRWRDQQRLSCNPDWVHRIMKALRTPSVEITTIYVSGGKYFEINQEYTFILYLSDSCPIPKE